MLSRFATRPKRRRNAIEVNPEMFLTDVAAQGGVTRSSALRDHPFYTRGQITYWLDKLHQQRKLRRHRGKRGAFVYTFRHY